MMELPTEIATHFRTELEKYEKEHQVPYVTSIEKMAAEEDRDVGLSVGQTAGQIQMAQVALRETQQAMEELIQLPWDQRIAKRDELRQRLLDVK